MKTGPKKLIALDENFFEKIDNELSAYWLGFAFADGSMVRNKTTGMFQFAFHLAEKDKEHLELFNKDLKSDFSISKTKTRS